MWGCEVQRSHATGLGRERHLPIPAWRLWSAILVAPAAWAAQGGLGWFYGERVCTSMSVESVRLVVGGVGLLAVVAAIWALLVAWSNWRDSDANQPLDAGDRITFMSLCGLVVSASFVVGTAWAGVAPLLIDRCGGMR